MKKYPLLAKTLSLLLLGVLLWIPLKMISGKISERSNLQQQVEREIEATAFGAQRVVALKGILRHICEPWFRYPSNDSQSFSPHSRKTL